MFAQKYFTFCKKVKKIEWFKNGVMLWVRYGSAVRSSNRSLAWCMMMSHTVKPKISCRKVRQLFHPYIIASSWYMNEIIAATLNSLLVYTRIDNGLFVPSTPTKLRLTRLNDVKAGKAKDGNRIRSTDNCGPSIAIWLLQVSSASIKSISFNTVVMHQKINFNSCNSH